MEIDAEELSYEIASENDYEKLKKSMIKSYASISRKYLNHPNAIPPGIQEGNLLKDWIPKGEVKKIMYQDSIIGGYKLDTTDPNQSWIHYIWIDEEYMRSGIGTRTWEFIKQENPKVNRWMMFTPKYAITNKSFYEKIGFEKIDEQEYEDVTLLVYENEV